MRSFICGVSSMSLISFLLMVSPRVTEAVVCEEIPPLGCAMCPTPGQCPQKLDGRVVMNSGRRLTCQNVQDTALDGFLKCDFLQANYNIDDCECGPSTANAIIAPEPTPAPTMLRPPNNADMCFAASAIVDVRGKGPMPLSDVSIGDYVQVSGEKYEQIYSFGHRQPEAKNHEFMQISTTSSNIDPLVLTSNHMVFIKENHAVPASMLKLGDHLLMADASVAKVSSIERVNRKDGLMAPFTPSGKIIVNGVVASTFVGFNTDSESLFGWSYQWLAHAFEFPHRFVCHYLGACPKESYDEDGVSMWVSRPNQWFLQYHELLSSYPGVAAVAISPFIMILAAFTLLEQCFFISWTTTVGLLVLSATLAIRSSHQVKVRMQGKAKTN